MLFYSEQQTLGACYVVGIGSICFVLGMSLQQAKKPSLCAADVG